MDDISYRNIQEWLRHSLHHLEAGTQLDQYRFRQIPCYHFKMAAELALKALTIVFRNLPPGYYDHNPTHSIVRLWENCRSELEEPPETDVLQNAVEVFTLYHTDYIYVKYSNNILHVPSSHFTSQDVSRHRKAAEEICRIVSGHLTHYL